MFSTIVDPRTNLLACNGYPGQLQFYDINTEICSSELEVRLYYLWV